MSYLQEVEHSWPTSSRRCVRPLITVLTTSRTTLPLLDQRSRASNTRPLRPIRCSVCASLVTRGLLLPALLTPRATTTNLAESASLRNKLSSGKRIRFFDAQTVEDRLDHVARARGTTNLGKFRTSCKEMLATNSQGAALQKACQQMRAGVGKIKMETS